MREARRDQALFERKKLGFARKRQRDGVGFGRQLPGRTLTGSVDKLRGKRAQGQIAADDAVMSERLPLRNRARCASTESRFGGKVSGLVLGCRLAGRLGCRALAGCKLVDLNSYPHSSASGIGCQVGCEIEG
jgi:hypothetical protein